MTWPESLGLVVERSIFEASLDRTWITSHQRSQHCLRTKSRRQQEICSLRQQLEIHKAGSYGKMKKVVICQASFRTASKYKLVMQATNFSMPTFLVYDSVLRDGEIHSTYIRKRK